MLASDFHRWSLGASVCVACSCGALGGAGIPVVTLGIRSTVSAGEPLHRRLIVACALSWADRPVQTPRGLWEEGLGEEPAGESSPGLLESGVACELPALCRWEQSARDSALANAGAALPESIP